MERPRSFLEYTDDPGYRITTQITNEERTTMVKIAKVLRRAFSFRPLSGGNNYWWAYHEI